MKKAFALEASSPSDLLKKAKKVLNECLSRGMLTYPCGHRSQTIRLSPPLNVTHDQIDEAIKILEQSIAAV